MSARRLDCEAVYEAADLWIASALRSDDSLFTPGTPIWSERWLGEARERFLDRPDEWRGAGFFDGKLERVLAGSPPEVYQLMAEAMYVSYLILYKSKVKQSKKIERVNQILGWSPDPISLPDNLYDGLESGIMAPGGFVDFGSNLAVVVEFAERWKKNGSDTSLLNRDDPEAPWRFQEFVAKFTTLAKRMALLHFAHPDYFEAIAAVHKNSVAKEPNFQRHVTTKTKDVDCKIYQIRKGLEPKYGVGFDFIKPPVGLLWGNNQNNGDGQ